MIGEDVKNTTLPDLKAATAKNAAAGPFAKDFRRQMIKQMLVDRLNKQEG